MVPIVPNNIRRIYRITTVNDWQYHFNIFCGSFRNSPQNVKGRWVEWHPWCILPHWNVGLVRKCEIWNIHVILKFNPVLPVMKSLWLMRDSFTVLQLDIFNWGIDLMHQLLRNWGLFCRMGHGCVIYFRKGQSFLPPITEPILKRVLFAKTLT